MANVIINDINLTNIADAIRGKNGTATTYKVSEMASAITNLPSGGGEMEPMVFSGNLNSFNYSGTWDSVITKYGSYISTEEINDLEAGFENSRLTKIPFDLNFVSEPLSYGGNTLSGAFRSMPITETPVMRGYVYRNLNSVFSNCVYLKTLKFRDDLYVNSHDYVVANSMCYNCVDLETVEGKFPVVSGTPFGAMKQMFNYCYKLKSIPVDYFDGVASYASTSSAGNGNMFECCYSLRQAPKTTQFARNRQQFYAYNYQNCYSLDELTDLGVYTAAAMTSNRFNYSFDNCCRLKRLVFETNEDGTPVVAQWTNQTIDLTYVGYFADSWRVTDMLQYNTDITADKEVYLDSTASLPYRVYTALKDDPDWYTAEVGFSRYDRKSAVETINSLPDCSAYGGSNTIKFNRLAGNTKGSSSDATNMSKLSTAEIAVATAKGWTVTLV